MQKMGNLGHWPDFHMRGVYLERDDEAISAEPSKKKSHLFWCQKMGKRDESNMLENCRWADQGKIRDVVTLGQGKSRQIKFPWKLPLFPA